MYRPQFVNVRQHHFDAPGLGLEAGKPQQRVEPDQPPAGPVQPVDLEAEPLVGVALSPSVNSSTTAPWVSTRRDHCLLNTASEVAIRVPPDQSSTLAEQAAECLVRVLLP